MSGDCISLILKAPLSAAAEDKFCHVLLDNWQRCSQNVEKVTRIKGRLLDQAMILFNCISFQMVTSLKGKNLLQEGAILSFMSSSL